MYVAISCISYHHISLPARCTDNKNLEKMIPYIVLDCGGQDSLFESRSAT